MNMRRQHQGGKRARYNSIQMNDKLKGLKATEVKSIEGMPLAQCLSSK
jgi:hypothetical protein